MLGGCGGSGGCSGVFVFDWDSVSGPFGRFVGGETGLKNVSRVLFAIAVVGIDLVEGLWRKTRSSSRQK